MRYRLRTLLIVLALGPPVLAGGWWVYDKYRPKSRAERRQELLRKWEEIERKWYEAGGPSLDEEPVIGYPPISQRKWQRITND